jgi:hypothetical protein
MRRRHIASNPIALAMSNVATLPAHEREGLRTIYEGAFNDFRAGRDCRSKWCELAFAINMAEAFADLRIGSDAESRAHIQAAHNALAAVAQRQKHTGSWTLYPAEITALDDALFIHRVQLEHCSFSEFHRAKNAVVGRQQQALSGNAGPRVTVVDMRETAEA